MIYKDIRYKDIGYRGYGKDRYTQKTKKRKNCIKTQKKKSQIFHNRTRAHGRPFLVIGRGYNVMAQKAPERVRGLITGVFYVLKPLFRAVLQAATCGFDLAVSANFA